jgi:hypothetical protein
MSEQTNIPYFIALVTDVELDRDQLRLWFAIAKYAIPSGLRSTVQVQAEGGGLISVPMVCKEGSGMFRYFIPLTRNLIESEAEPIVRAMAKAIPDLDFDLIVSKADVEDAPEEHKIELQHEKYDAICRAYAKRQHEQWVLKAGWRYAIEMSPANRTSPMLRPWDELPEALRKIDYDHPQTLVDLLGEQGYAVVRKDELKAMYALLTRTP